jgi:hypothetical protein
MRRYPSAPVMLLSGSEMTSTPSERAIIVIEGEVASARQRWLPIVECLAAHSTARSSEVALRAMVAGTHIMKGYRNGSICGDR